MYYSIDSLSLSLSRARALAIVFLFAVGGLMNVDGCYAGSEVYEYCG